MAPIPVSSRHERDSHLEAGLLSTADEEKAALIQEAVENRPPKDLDRPQKPCRRMSPSRKLAVAIIFGLFVGLGLTLAKDTVGRHCREVAHAVYTSEGQALKVVRRENSAPELARRQEGGVNTTSSGAGVDSQTSTTPTPPTTSSAPSSSSQPPTSSTPTSKSSETSISTPSSTPQISSSTPTPTPPSSSSTPVPPTTSTPPSTSERPSSTPSTSQEPSSSTGTSTAIEPTSSAFSSSTSAPVSTSSSSSKEESATPTPTTTQETVTTGSITTSSAVRKTLTTTLPDGGVTTLTSTSWVAVVPTGTPTGTSGNRDLQNAAPPSHGAASLVVAAGAMLAGLMMA